MSKKNLIKKHTKTQGFCKRIILLALCVFASHHCLFSQTNNHATNHKQTPLTPDNLFSQGAGATKSTFDRTGSVKETSREGNFSPADYPYLDNPSYYESPETLRRLNEQARQKVILEYIEGYIAALLLLFFLYSGIAYLEQRLGNIDVFHKGNWVLSCIGIVSFSFLLLLFIAFKNDIVGYSSIENKVLIGFLIIRVIMAFIVANEAKKLNRDQTLWFVLGFIEFSIAFIVLGMKMFPKLIAAPRRLKPQIDDINTEIKEKISNLNELNNSGHITNEEYDVKRKELINQYNNVISLLLTKDAEEGLKNAYETGLLTEEEYKNKLTILSSR